MTHPDAETLAAFVDGRLSAAERSRVVEHLADCDPCHAVVTDTVHLLRDPALAEDEEEEISPVVAPGKVLRPPAGRFRRALPLAALAAAALVALLVWTPAGEWILNPLFPTAGSVAELAEPLPADDSTSAAVGTVARHWPVYLGPDDGISHASATAFRLGVRNAELGVALAADAGSVGEYSAEILSLLGDLDVFFAHIASLYEPAPTPAGLADADRKLAELLDRDAPWYALGRWAGVARVAADAGHTGWFARPSPRRTLRSLRRDDWPPQVAGRLDAVATLADGGVDADERAALRSDLAELIRVASGE